MRVEITVETRCAEDGNERNYVYAIEFSDKNKLEDVEAHAANIIRLLDRQASDVKDDDDEKDDGDTWKPNNENPKKQP